MKIFFRRIHLYLGLAAGLVILIACLTGAILVFEKDLQMAMNKSRYYVEAQTNRLPADTIIEKVKTAYPKAKINGIKLYKDQERSAEVSVTLGKKDGENKEQKGGGKPARQPGYTIFVNPYSGAVLDQYTYSETFFYKVFALHRWLLGGQGSVGKYIVGISTLIFLFIIITGVILWWPKTRKVLQQRLTVKWGSSWKRVNHDLHVVFGFYSGIFLFIFAFTGLAWSFEWFNKGIYKVTNSQLKNPEPPTSVYAQGKNTISYEDALKQAQNVFTDASFFSVSTPKDSTSALSVSSLSENAVHESATDVLYLDQYSGEVLRRFNFGDRSLGAQVRSSFKPIHTGSIWGMPSKIIAFIVCLFGVSFPITGTIMWLNRTRKKKKAMGKRKVEAEEVEYY